MALLAVSVWKMEELWGMFDAGSEAF